MSDKSNIGYNVALVEYLSSEELKTKRFVKKTVLICQTELKYITATTSNYKTRRL